MQKLLCVLMFGMMFGQTKLETRVYKQIVDLSNESINIKNLTNTDLPYYSVRIFAESIKGGPCKFKVSNNLNGYIDFQHELITGSQNAIVDDFYLIGSHSTDLTFSTLWNNQCGDEMVQFWVTAEFPQEDTGYIEDGFDYCLHTGANLVSSPCRDEVAIESAIPSDILQNITGIITEGGAASNLGGNWVGSLNGLGGGKGYWVISDIDGCFNYTCSEEN
tara:strand:- start:89 stop:745 length:657 start_codon:yes stop_codon:yes gene_type:complete